MSYPWVRLSVSGKADWFNLHHVRLIEAASSRAKGEAKLVYTTKHSVVVDQSPDEIMAAIGYQPPPPEPVEHHHVAGLEDELLTPSGGSDAR